jgi:hypothetical protein
MDKTSYCRDKCASSANILACMTDCQGRPMPLSAIARGLGPDGLFDPSKKRTKQIAMIAGGVAVVVIVFLLVRK